MEASFNRLPALLCALLFMVSRRDPLNLDDPCYLYEAYGRAQVIFRCFVFPSCGCVERVKFAFICSEVLTHSVPLLFCRV